MKTKRTVFEVNDVYRVMENSELIYTLTNSEKLKREEYKYEEMWVLLLNSSSKLIRKVRISCGGINTAPVDIRVIMKQALYYNAVSFIMVHNHPSGARKPSSADDRLTEAVKKAAETLDIRLVDHVIVAGNNYYSYADEGRLQNR